MEVNNKQQGNVGRKPYAKPEIVSENIFEVSAVGCLKVYGSSDACNGTPDVS